jgi:hypothetical protein
MSSSSQDSINQQETEQNLYDGNLNMACEHGHPITA